MEDENVLFLSFFVCFLTGCGGVLGYLFSTSREVEPLLYKSVALAVVTLLVQYIPLRIFAASAMMYYVVQLGGVFYSGQPLYNSPTAWLLVGAAVTGAGILFIRIHFHSLLLVAPAVLALGVRVYFDALHFQGFKTEWWLAGGAITLITLLFLGSRMVRNNSTPAHATATGIVLALNLYIFSIMWGA